MKGLILAGGSSSRLGSLSQVKPKAKLMINDDYAIDHLISRFGDIGVDWNILTSKRFENFFESYDNVLVEEVSEDEDGFGAVSAILHFIERQDVDEDLFVLAADNYFGDIFLEMVYRYSEKPMIGVTHAGSVPGIDPSEMGTVSFHGSEEFPPPEKSFDINYFKENSIEPASDYVSTGAYILPKSVFPVIEDFCEANRKDNLGHLIEYFLERGVEVDGYYFEGEWHDVEHRSYLNAISDGELERNDESALVVSKEVGDLEYTLNIVNPGESITGRADEDKGIVCFFVEGSGIFEVDGEDMLISSNDSIPIMPGQSYEIYNDTDADLVFLTTFRK